MAENIIEQFKQNMDDYASPNRFRVTVTPPTSLINPGGVHSLTFTCFKAIIPGLVYGSYMHRSGTSLGEERPNDIINPKLTLGFYNGIANDGSLVQDFWYNWSRLVNASTETYEYHDNYIGTINVEQLDKKGNSIRTWKFLDCWPKELGDIQLDYGTVDQVQTFDVGIAYRTYRT